MEGKTPEQILEDARALIGSETAPVPSRYPVEYDPIRRYCHMVGDDNPLFLDPEYAATTHFSGVIAPPFYIRNMSGPGRWPPVREAAGITSLVPTPGDRNVNLSTEFDVLAPVRVGDSITKTQRLADVYIKPVRLDPQAFWIVYETIYRNQADEVVLVERNTLMRHRSPEQIAGAAAIAE